ncbi:MAG: hypothetical protein ACRDHZ_25485, partial [Ktedonobacteraceae bacterium]
MRLLVLLSALTIAYQASAVANPPDTRALTKAEAKAIAEYRLPLPGAGIKSKDIPDGNWYNSLSDKQKTDLLYLTPALKQSLDDFYRNAANLRIPYLEAKYIVAMQKNHAPEAQIKLELLAARAVMRGYYSMLGKPNLYMAYDSLAALRNDLFYNALKKDRIIASPSNKTPPILTIENAKVFSVDKNEKWPGVIVMTYSKIDGQLLFAPVYVSRGALKDNLKTRQFI